MSYKVINLKDIYDSIGETKDILKSYKCEINKDVDITEATKKKVIAYSRQVIHMKEIYDNWFEEWYIPEKITKEFVKKAHKYNLYLYL